MVFWHPNHIRFAKALICKIHSNLSSVPERVHCTKEMDYITNTNDTVCIYLGCQCKLANSLLQQKIKHLIKSITHS